MDTLAWSQECAYIARVADKGGRVREMNNSPAVFIRYCKMQRDTATREGHYDSAQYIQHCLDDIIGAGLPE